MQINGVPILEAPLFYGTAHRRSGVAVGIMHEDGIVSEYECREAAVFAQMTWREFCELDWRDRALTVAHKRVSSLIEQHHIADASLGL